MLPGAVVLGAKVFGTVFGTMGEALGAGARLGAKPGVATVPGIGESDGAPLGTVIIGPLTPSEA
jgi:hypothetical protein